VIQDKGDDCRRQEKEDRGRPHSHWRGCSGAGCSSPMNYHSPSTPRQSWGGQDKTYSPSGDWKDLAWVLRSSKGSTAAPSRASWPVASLPGIAIAQPLTARHYRG
jgi:hypothetical protein